MDSAQFHSYVMGEVDRMRVLLMAAKPGLDWQFPNQDPRPAEQLCREAAEAIDVFQKKLLELAKLMPTAADRAAAEA